MAWVRPDGRVFVRTDELAGDANRDVYVEVPEDDAAAIECCERAGFAVNRRESVYRIPPAVEAVDVPPGYVFLRADEIEEGRLRLLDDVLRQDVPGTDGWRWDEAGFHAELEQPAFDPATYLVAVETATGDPVGIARVWRNPGGPRLGFVGVLRDHRRRGLARALVASVLREVRSDVTTEIDDANVASRTLLAGFGARRTGGLVELVRRVRP